jgi:hypothetical protein
MVDVILVAAIPQPTDTAYAFPQHFGKSVFRLTRILTDFRVALFAGSPFAPRRREIGIVARLTNRDHELRRIIIAFGR